MDKDEKKLLVIKNSVLFEGDDVRFNGFIPINKTQIFKKLIADNLTWMVRKIAEFNFDYKQLIPYTIVVNENNKKILAYQRSSKKENSHESRLHGRWSIGVGGHIDDDDVCDFDDTTPIEKSLKREFLEELSLDISPKDCKLVGFLNDDSEEVGKVHFGLIYVFFTKKKELILGDKEIVQYAFKTKEQLKDISKNENMETWSKILIDSLDKILDNFSY